LQRESRMTDEVAIKVDHVSKKYCKSLKRSMLYGVKDIGRNILGMSSHPENLRKSEFWALDGVSFEVKKGETLGIIGPNGSGKTTLLKLLNGIFWPDKGKITVERKMGALIQIGAGFHPLLTGRENVYLNAAILGMTKKEVDRKFDDIVEFADIGDFIDTPVKFYSSGMFVRLGFAVAVHCEPDILLVDEVLAVGDFDFQTKCYSRLNKLKKSGVTSILVSHNMPHIVQNTDRCIWLHRGKIMEFGNTWDVCAAYLKFMQNKVHSMVSGDGNGELFGGIFTTGEDVWDMNMNLINRVGEPIENISAFEPLWIDYDFATRRTGSLGLTFKIHRQDGMLLAVINNLLDRVEIRAKNEKVAGRLRIDALNLIPGRYVLVIVVQEGVEYLYRAPGMWFNVSQESQEHDLYRHGVVQTLHKWQET